MANINSPRGLSPYSTITGAAWNEVGQTFAIASDSSNTYAIGDVVSLAGGSDTNGIAYVTKSTATSVPVGVIVGLRVADYGVSLQGTNLNLTQLYLPLSSGLRYAVVCTDPNIIFRVESDATGTASADVGKNCNAAITANQTTLATSSPLSNATLDSTTYIAQNITGSLSKMFTIIGIDQRPDNAPGSYADALVIFNRHQYKQAQGTA
jgi:hypothetical protein